LLRRENFEPEIYDELSALHHQTYRLTGVIDDLLLLSRMDAGHLEIEIKPVNLSALIEEWLEDLNALPDPLDLEVKTHVPPALYIAGEKRYTSLILQNPLENARKDNQPGGRIHVSARADNGRIVLTVGDGGRPLAAGMKIFRIALGFAFMICAISRAGAQDFLDRVDQALTFSAFHDDVRARLSGTLDLEGYVFQQSAPGLILSKSDALFNPRLNLF